MAKGSLLPENAVGGGAVPDGDYTIEAVAAQMFNYGGTQADTPAICVTYKADDGNLVEQNYTAGKGSSLHTSGDGKRFEVIGKNSNAWMWLSAIIAAGFPKEKVDEDVTVFNGTKVHVVNTAQPKRPGLKDQVEGKTIPLVTKVLALPGERKAATKTAAKPSLTAPTSNGSGDLDALTVAQVLESLAEAPDNKLTRVKLGTTVMLRLSKAKDPNMAAIKKLASDSVWLNEHAADNGWAVEGDEVQLQ